MSTLFDPILNFSSLRSDYLESPPNRSIFERFSLSSMVINIIIPLIVVIFVIFILKERYDNKQKKLAMALAFSEHLKKQEKLRQKRSKYRDWRK